MTRSALNDAKYGAQGDAGPLFHRSPAPTELSAARRAGRTAPKLRDEVLAWIAEAGTRGLTTKEARARFLEERGRDDGYSTPPRFSELRARGLIVATGEVRDGAMVYMAAKS